jgi:hydrogenase-4 component F
MSWEAILPALPLLSAMVLGALRNWRLAALLNICSSLATLVAAAVLAWTGAAPTDFFLADRLALHLALLTSWIGATTAFVSLGYVHGEVAKRRLDGARLRLYHAMYQALLGFMLLALLSNNYGVTWVAIEAATIAGVLVVGLPRTAEAVEASWKYFLICGVGISLALFGTIVLYMAALPALGPGLAAMRWNTLLAQAANCNGSVLNLAFVFLLLGYGTKASLAPLHAWMPDAHAEGPTPLTAVLSGSMMNVALAVILRLRSLLAGNTEAIAPGPPIMALGLLSVLLASFSLWRRRDVKRFFAFSSIEQGGVAAFAFGLGGPVAVFAGMLHLTLHTLIKAAIYTCVGWAAQLKGGQKFADISGLLPRHFYPGLLLAGGIVAVAGLPPFGLFASEFMIVVQTVQKIPLLAAPLCIGLLAGAWATLGRLQMLCLGPPTTDMVQPGFAAITLWPAALHLAIAILLGLAMPATLVAWFADISLALSR